MKYIFNVPAARAIPDHDGVPLLWENDHVRALLSARLDWSIWLLEEAEGYLSRRDGETFYFPDETIQ